MVNYHHRARLLCRFVPSYASPSQPIPRLTLPAQIICAAAVVASSDAFVVKQWSTYLIFLAILTFALNVNIWGNRILGRWNDAACKSLSSSTTLIFSNKQCPGLFLAPSLSESFFSPCRKRATLPLSSLTSTTRRAGQMACPGFSVFYNLPFHSSASMLFFTWLKRCLTLPEMHPVPWSTPSPLEESRKKPPPPHFL